MVNQLTVQMVNQTTIRQTANQMTIHWVGTQTSIRQIMNQLTVHGMVNQLTIVQMMNQITIHQMTNQTLPPRNPMLLKPMGARGQAS